MTKSGLLRAGLVASLAAFAFRLVFETGTRGFLAFDQSIVFDGGYRVFLGQVPFRDFFAPTGPVPFWIQGAFFRLGSVGYPTYLLHAAVANALAAVLAFTWVRSVFPGTNLYPFLGGALTAIWFYPLFGTPWIDQTAFLFHLIAMVCLIAAYRGAGRETGFAAAAGVATVLAFLSKQNAGMLTLAALVLLPFSFEREKRNLALRGAVFGLAGASVAFALWLFVRSHPGRFWTFFFEIPSGEGVRRLSDLSAFFTDVVLEELAFSDPVRATSVLAVVLALGAWVSGRGRNRVAAASIISLFLYQVLFIHVTNNEPENAFAFAGLIAALGLGLARSVAGGTPSLLPRTSLAALAVVAVVSLGRYGWDLARSRYVHDVFFRSSFDDQVVSKALSPVRWAQPTPAARRARETIAVEDLDVLADYLRDQPESFFVFPDYTILYGVTGKTPPQPLLWFHPGLTYSREEAPWLDAYLVRELHKNQVRLVVLERASWQGTERRLSDFPALARFVHGAFVPAREFGNFEVLKRRE